MNLGDQRNLLRVLIGDTSGVTWSDAELNVNLNQAYFLVQKEIRKVAPEAHLFWDYMNTTAGTSWYPLPSSFGIVHVGLKQTTADTRYKILTRKKHRNIEDLETLTNPSKGPFYTRRGQWIGIFPPPTAGVTKGLELVHIPIMSMSGDEDIPRIKVPTHIMIVWWAKLICLGETDESTQETQKRLDEAITDLPMWYDEDADEQTVLEVVGYQ